MIQLLTQTTEFYCSTEKEAEEILSSRKEESVGKIVKHSSEDKGVYVKLVIKEEYNIATELTKEEPDDENEYHEMFDEDPKVIEHVERIDE